jgi:hypothetical protein
MAITKASSNAVAPAAKGDLVVGSATNDAAVLGVGANGTVLTAASGEATGLQWATPTSGGMTLLSTTTLSGATTTISGISGSYTNLYGIIYGVTNATANGNFSMQIAGSATFAFARVTDGNTINTGTNTNVIFNESSTINRTDSANVFRFMIHSYSNANINNKPVEYFSYYEPSTPRVNLGWGVDRIGASAITQLSFSNSGGNFSTGTVLLYGVK